MNITKYALLGVIGLALCGCSGRDSADPASSDFSSEFSLESEVVFENHWATVRRIAIRGQGQHSIVLSDAERGRVELSPADERTNEVMIMAMVDDGSRTFTWWVTDYTLADGKRVSGGAGSPETVTLTSEFPVPEKPYLEHIVQWNDVDGSFPYGETVALGSFLVKLPGSPELTLSVK
jgi:hypothetical protein